MREGVLKELARRAAADPGFLARARADLPAALAAGGYELSPDELRAVEDLRRRTASMSDAELARTLADGLRRRGGAAPTRPGAPGRPGGGPARPAWPGG
jgi:fructose 1,6-bisphosphatase